MNTTYTAKKWMILLKTTTTAAAAAISEDTSPLHYSNKICFLGNDDFDYMIAAKHEGEEAIGWKVLPENIVYRVEQMSQIQTKGGSRSSLTKCNGTKH